MTEWDIYDEAGNWLGTAMGFNESEALAHAKTSGMGNAVKASPCED